MTSSLRGPCTAAGAEAGGKVCRALISKAPCEVGPHSATRAHICVTQVPRQDTKNRVHSDPVKVKHGGISVTEPASFFSKTGRGYFTMLQPECGKREELSALGGGSTPRAAPANPIHSPSSLSDKLTVQTDGVQRDACMCVHGCNDQGEPSAFLTAHAFNPT